MRDENLRMREDDQRRSDANDLRSESQMRELVDLVEKVRAMLAKIVAIYESPQKAGAERTDPA